MKKSLNNINLYGPIVFGILWFLFSIRLIEPGGFSGLMLIYPHFWGLFLGPIIVSRSLKHIKSLKNDNKTDKE